MGDYLRKIRAVLKAFVKGNSLIRKAIVSKIRHKVSKRICFVEKGSLRFIHRIDIRQLNCTKCIDKEILEHYFKHEYNFLGTGWVSWNKSECKCQESYVPIEWHKDILFDYTFQEEYFDSNLIKQLPQGVDIKIPWELGRMYYWPQLSLYAINHTEMRDEIVREFINQMNDFMDNNKLGIGVQFYCAMEISIRSINLLMSYDILTQLLPERFDKEFTEKFERYLYSQLNVIVDRLELDFFSGQSGNHYLSDLCGILWICMYFDSYKSDKYGQAAAKEFSREIGLQFLEDGSNYECSTGYHMLSSELTALAYVAMRRCFNKDIDMVGVLERIEKMRDVADIFVAVDGKIVQIGDYDSGRVIKLQPVYRESMEDTLIVSEVSCLLNAVLFVNAKGNWAIEAVVHSYLDNHAEGKKKDMQWNTSESTYEGKGPIAEKYESMPYKKYREIPLTGEWERFKCKNLKEFGLIKLSDDNEDIYIRTIPNYKRMELAHAHDDVFSYQIITKSRREGEDLGSIAYTSDIVTRMKLANSEYHNVPIHPGAIIRKSDYFISETSAEGEATIRDNVIEIVVHWNGICHVRKFVVEERCLKIFDYSDEFFDVSEVNDNFYSLGYGQLYRRDTNEHVRKIS